MEFKVDAKLDHGNTASIGIHARRQEPRSAPAPPSTGPAPARHRMGAIYRTPKRTDRPDVQPRYVHRDLQAAAPVEESEDKGNKTGGSFRRLGRGFLLGTLAVAGAPLALGAVAGIAATGPIAGGVFAGWQAAAGVGGLAANGLAAGLQSFVMSGVSTKAILSGGVLGAYFWGFSGEDKSRQAQQHKS